jgi:hypothetical protein
MIDVISVVPTFLRVAFFPHDIYYHDVITFPDVINYVVYALATTRILRILHGHQNVDHISDLVKRWSGHRMMTVVTILLFGE